VTRHPLAGNGAELVRERAIASAVQRSLGRLYRLEGAPDVHPFLEVADDGEREALFVREAPDGAVEMALRVPRMGEGLDTLCQIIEGVSHFVYLAERARVAREATQLEMELQAEVDKYVVLAGAIRELDVRRSSALRAELYERVVFAHGAASVEGARYRIANELAAKFVRALERRYLAANRVAEMRDELRRFFQMGQEDKLRVSQAA